MRKKNYFIVKQVARDAAHDVFVEVADFYNKYKILCHVWVLLYGMWIGTLIWL